MKRYILFSFIFCISLPIFAQKIIERSNPYGRLPWVNGELPSNKNSTNYKVVLGEASSLSEARNTVLFTLVSDLGKDKGVTVNSSSIIKVREEINSKNPGFFKQITNNDIEISVDEYKISFAKVDEYFEIVKTSKGVIYKLWQLFAIGSHPRLKEIEYTSSYGAPTIIKSSIVPGWGQFDKNKSTKGILFLVAEGAALGAFISANNSYNYNINRSQETQSLELKKEFRKLADKDLSIKNASLGLAVGVWLWNIIDAASPNGAPKYASNKLRFNLTSSVNDQLAINMKIKL